MKQNRIDRLNQGSVVSAQHLRRHNDHNQNEVALTRGAAPGSQVGESPSFLLTRSRTFWGVNFNPGLEVSRAWSLLGLPLGYIFGYLL